MASKALREAQARVRELEATIAAAQAAEKAANDAIGPSRARHSALLAKQSKVLTLTQAGGQPNSNGGGIRLMSLAGIGLGWDATRLGSQPVKKVAEMLLSGQQKITPAGSSVSYTLRGMLARTRMINVARLRNVNKAVKARERAQAALSRAWQAEREAYIEAYDAGDKPDLQAIALAIAKRITTPIVAAPINPQLRQAKFDAEREIDNARRHLGWVKASNPDKGVCPCWTCQRERREAQELTELRTRLAELPTVVRKCPQHGSKRMPTERVAREWVNTGEQQELLQNVPILWCPGKGTPHRLIDGRTLTAEREKAAKAAARKAGKAPAREWVCPNPECGEVNDYVPDNGSVTCEACEVEYDADVVKVTRKEQQAA